MPTQHHPARRDRPPRDGAPWRARLHEIIFEADTPAGLAFDVALLLTVAASVIVVLLASVADIAERHGPALLAAEWAFTLLFTVEYGLRLASVRHPLRYAASFYGVVDLLSLLPTWVGLFVPGAESMLVIRVLRVARIFRVFKLAPYLVEGEVLLVALGRSRHKIAVFLTSVFSAVIVVGAAMFVIEGPEHGFTSIPVSMYWAIVTITTVGYGDISPETPLGQLVASMLMVLGYAIIAVPTGIVSVELAEASRAARPTTQACPACAAEGHDADATYCKRCGAHLNPAPPAAAG